MSGPGAFWDLDREVGSEWTARRELAAALRELSERCIRTDADEALLTRAAAVVREITTTLPQGPTAHEAFVGGAYFADPTEWVDRTALMGHSNPVAPPMIVRREDDTSVCDLELDERYVGAPGMAHGGVIAAVFDQLCGHCVVMGGLSGFTTILKVRYRLKTPLHTPLTFRADITSLEGRVIELHGTCHRDDILVSECDATFLRMDPEAARAVIRGT